MLRVLFVVDDMKYGGVSSVLIETLRRLDRDQFSADLLILHSHGELLDRVPPHVTKISGTSFFCTVNQSFSSLKSNRDYIGMARKALMAICLKTGIAVPLIRRQRRRLLTKEYDIEIAYKDGFCTVFTYAGDTPKKLAWVHNDYRIFSGSDRYMSLMSRAFSSMDRVAAVSKRAAESLKLKFNLDFLPFVVLNPIDSERVVALSEQFTPEFDPLTFNFVSIGRLSQEKGYDRLLRIHRKLLGDGYPHRIYLVGAGEDGEKLRAEAERNHVEDSFIFLGYQGNPYPYMKYANFCVLSSLYEAAPVVVSEALILKTPVIATEVADVRENVELMGYGIVTGNTERELYDGMKLILMDKSLQRKYKENLSCYTYNSASIIKNIELFIEGGM